ncbi:MAG: hypothetical protein V4633_10375 [Pseudomonadota bacterium]
MQSSRIVFTLPTPRTVLVTIAHLPMDRHGGPAAMPAASGQARSAVAG